MSAAVNVCATNSAIAAVNAKNAGTHNAAKNVITAAHITAAAAKVYPITNLLNRNFSD